MPVVTHLLTICDLGSGDHDPRPLSGSIDAAHFAVLDGGRRTALLLDRG